PAAVAEVPLDLADDVRRRVGGQLDPPLEVEAVDRLDQPDRADLDQVVELLAAVGVPPGERAHERHVPLDQLLAGGEIALLVVGAKELLVGRRERHQVSETAVTAFEKCTHAASSSSATR